MNGKASGYFTEPMYYVLLAFRHGPMCGQDVAAFVKQLTEGRVQIGPGTLYTILGKFLKDGLLEEIEVVGRKRTYQLTPLGSDFFARELERLRLCIADAEKEEKL